MSKNTVYTDAVITLNDNEAKARIAEIKDRMAAVRAEMEKISKEKGIDSKEYKKAEKTLLSLSQAQKKENEQMEKFRKIMNNLNGSNLNDLQFAAKKLNQELRRLKPGTDAFVAQSYKLKEVRQKMRDIEGQAKSTQSVFGSFWTKIGWAGLVAGAIGLFKKLSTDMVSQTQAFGDRWRHETAGWKEAYNSFVATLSSGKGWKDLIANMRESYRVGKEVSAILDELFERRNSLSVEESEAQKTIEEQKRIMKDVTRTDKERIAAAETIDRMERSIAERKKEIAQQELDANTKLLLNRTKMSKEEVDTFIVNYNNNRELIQQGEEYNQKIKDREKALKGLKFANSFNEDPLKSQEFIESIQNVENEIKRLKANASEEVRWFAEMNEKYSLSNDELVTKWVQSNNAVILADVEYLQRTQKTNSTAAQLRKSITDEVIKDREKAYKNSIKAVDNHQKEMTNKAKEDYSKGIIEEKDYNARILTIQEEGLKKKKDINERFKKETVEYNSQLYDLSFKQRKDLQKLLDDTEKDAAKVAEEIAKEAANEIEKIMEDLDQEFTLEVEHIQDLMQKSAEIFRSLHSLDTLKYDLGNELKELEDIYAQGLLSEEDFRKQKAAIVKKYSEQMTTETLKPYQAGMQKATALFGEAANAVSAIQEAHMTALDAQMQRELAAAGDNAEKRSEIEQNYERKKLDIQKRYADIDMAINIAKTIAAGSLAAVQAMAQLGPVAGMAMASLIAVTTAAEVATIVAQRNAIKNQTVSSSSASSSQGRRIAKGYASGGYTEEASNDYTEVGIVHANEWVAPAAMVRANPITFAHLETIRRSGHYNSGQTGFADGGRTAEQAREPLHGAQSQPLEEMLKRTNALLSSVLSQIPIKAYVVASEMNKENDLQNKVKSIVGKK